MMSTTTRNADLGSLVSMLQEQRTRKVDVVAPSHAVRAVNGRLVVKGAEPRLSEDGVTSADGTYTPTAVCDEGVAEKLGIPVRYLKTLRTERPDLYDANVNGWLHGDPEAHLPGTDSRSFLVRAFRGDDTGDGIARAFLSDRYALIDNLDVLMSALDGIHAAGVQVDVDGGDLTDRRMVVRVRCPEVAAMAPTLLRGYRSPFSGNSGDENPVVFAGFQISNSETGSGAFTIVPRLVVQVCSNGMTMTRDALSKVHLGQRLEAGVVQWAEDTQQKALDLVQAQTRDAVRTFLSPEYLTRTVQTLERKAGTEVETVDAVRTVVKPLAYSNDAVEGILAHFVKGGQMTLGGVVNAVTSFAQTVDDGDTAYDLETRATSLLV